MVINDFGTSFDTKEYDNILFYKNTIKSLINSENYQFKNLNENKLDDLYDIINNLLNQI